MLRVTAWGLMLAALAVFADRPVYVISGQVADERGEVARGVQVCAIPEGFDPKKRHVSIACGCSNANGHFSVSVGGPGKYTLYSDQTANGYWSQYLPFFRNPASPAPEVLLDEANPAVSVTIWMLPKNGVLSGRGVDAGTGRPVEDLEFIMCHADAPEVCRQTHAKSGEGRFRLPAPHVPFTVRVRAEGYDEWLGPDGGEAAAALGVAPATVQELDVRLKRSAGSEGRALGESEKRAGVHLPAPTQLAPADGAVFKHYPRRTRLEWAPVGGAASYMFEVDYCAGWREGRTACPDPQPHFLPNVTPGAGLDATAYEFNFVGAQPGRWRVWAIVGSGRAGFKSPWRSFAYLQ
jgi:hypothetical protein